MPKYCYQCEILTNRNHVNRINVWVNSESIEDVCKAIHRVLGCRIIKVKKTDLYDGI